MTRGRKKDLTIPPTRALAQQRDYRARKARYLAELEEHCRRVEQENALLKQEIESLKAGLPFTAPDSSVDPQLASASSELMRDLSAASSSLERFQKLAYSQRDSEPIPHPRRPSPCLSTSSSGSQHVYSAISRLRPAFFPSPPCSDVSLDPQHDLENEHEQYTWPETDAPEATKPPVSHSLRKILCLPGLSDSSPGQRNEWSSSPDDVEGVETGSPDLPS